MKKILDILFSGKTTFALLFVYGLALAIATFIENSYDTETAKALIYNAKWLEVIYILIVVNFIGNIKKYKLLAKNKIWIFVLHAAFILVIVGAAITRYASFEGMMHIREGETTNILHLSESCLSVYSEENDIKYSSEDKVVFNQATKSFNLNLETELMGKVEIKFNKFIPNAIEQIEENNENGVNMIKLLAFFNNTKNEIVINEGEKQKIGNIIIAYNNNDPKNDINITEQSGKFTIIAKEDLKRIRSNENESITDTIPSDSIVGFDGNGYFEINNLMFALTNYYQKAVNKLVSASDVVVPDAVIFDVKIKDNNYQATVFGGKGYNSEYSAHNFGEHTIYFSYGDKAFELPFSLKLEDFTLERYAGSSSPSSFASDVVLIDKNENITQNHKIFMNNVLDYKGYRFFQSSYDEDEKGTILSVNHDKYGTIVTYIGYFFLFLGFVLALFNKGSRFAQLRQKIKQLQIDRKKIAFTIILLIMFGGSSFAQNKITDANREHIDKFSELVAQTYSGRFAPVQTIAIDIMHKISRKDNFEIDGMGQMNATQVLIDMQLNADFWSNQKIIYVREKSVRKEIGISGKHAAFNDFITVEGQYKLQTHINKAFRKKQSERNTFDKEIIKVDERINICMMIFKGKMLNIFPLQDSKDDKWVGWGDSLSKTPLHGNVGLLIKNLELPKQSYYNLMGLYYKEFITARTSDNYSEADKILNYISNIQRNSSVVDKIPTKSQIKYEIFYNNSEIFVKLKRVYSMLSMLLMVLAFIDSLGKKKRKIVNILFYIFTGILALSFLYHTFGMGLRWYLTGHAPWSNGYEALILVAWSALLAGFSFLRSSKITLAASVLMAFFILMTAGHSSYDPQLTNLQPVLKSIWLIIHVATLTISYGFLGSSFLLGLINLFLYLFRTKKNSIRLTSVIKELSYISEMNISIGIVFATIGTFLGGIWANESWGRYWGWDAKETWALIIIIVYAIIMHIKFIPKLRNSFVFNASSVVGFGSVLMTFIGVNYFFTKGLHSYASGETPVFPMWAWISIFSIFVLIAIAAFRSKSFKDD